MKLSLPVALVLGFSAASLILSIAFTQGIQPEAILPSYSVYGWVGTLGVLTGIVLAEQHRRIKELENNLLKGS